MFALFGFLSVWQLVLVAFVALLLFGNRIPSVMRNLGQGITEFKKGMKEIEDQTEEEEPKVAK